MRACQQYDANIIQIKPLPPHEQDFGLIPERPYVPSRIGLKTQTWNRCLRSTFGVRQRDWSESIGIGKAIKLERDISKVKFHSRMQRCRLCLALPDTKPTAKPSFVDHRFERNFS